jgi:hypothetical protein
MIDDTTMRPTPMMVAYFAHYWIPGANSGGGVVTHPKYSLSTASTIRTANRIRVARVRTVIAFDLSASA